jgi:Tfp pilus assembly protein PilO
MTRTRRWTMGTAVIVLLLLLAGWFLLVSPKRASAVDLRAQTATQESTNSTLTAQIATLKVQKAGVPAQEAKLAVIRQRIPDNPALPGLIRSLSALAKSANVSLQSITPASPAANRSPAVTPALPATGTVPVLNTIAITVDFNGTYANVELFLNKLESLKRSFLVSGLQITPDSAVKAVGTNSPVLTVVLSGRVFDASTIGVVAAPASSTSSGGATTSSTGAATPTN